MRPLELLRDVLVAYRRQWRVLLGAALVVFSAINLAEGLVSELQFDRLHGRVFLTALVLAAASLTLSNFGEAFYEGVTAVAVGEWRSGVAHPRLLAVARSVRYFPLIAVNFVTALGTGVGLLFFVVPGFVFGTYTALAPTLVEVEELGVRGSIARSAELVRGSFWSVGLVLWGVYLVSNAATAGLEHLLESVTAEFVSKTVVEALLAPFYGLAAVLATHMLREG